MDIGKRLKKMRFDANETLSDVSKRVNISIPVLSRMENGDARVSDRVMYAYCKHYMVDFIEFAKECGRQVNVVKSVDGSKTYIGVIKGKGSVGYLEVK